MVQQATKKAPQIPDTWKPETIADKIDRLGKLEEELAPWKARLTELSELRSEVAGAFVGRPNQGGTLKGHEFIAVIKAMKNQTKIRSMSAVFALLGKVKFLAGCGYTLEKLKADAPAEYSSLTVKEHTGAREVKTYRAP